METLAAAPKTACGNLEREGKGKDWGKSNRTPLLAAAESDVCFFMVSPIVAADAQIPDYRRHSSSPSLRETVPAQDPLCAASVIDQQKVRAVFGL